MPSGSNIILYYHPGSLLFYRLFAMERKDKPSNTITWLCTMPHNRPAAFKLINIRSICLFSRSFRNPKQHEVRYKSHINVFTNCEQYSLSETHIKTINVFLKVTIKRVRHSSEMTFSGRLDDFWITKRELCVLLVHAIHL